MAIKWKSKIVFTAWIILLTFGLSGIMLGIFRGSEYFKGDYFQTPQFEKQMDLFIGYLNAFELGYMTREEAKENITVSAEEINEHRYRYGDLPVQIENIRGQYEAKIQNATQNKNKEIAELYIAERDKKIEDITNNFKSDEYVRLKVVKEKEQIIDEYYRHLENNRVEYERYRSIFKYYLQDSVNKAVYTNLTTAERDAKGNPLNEKDMLFLRTYPSDKYGNLTSDMGASYIINHKEESAPIARKSRAFTGVIGISKSAPAVNAVLVDYYDYEVRQQLFWGYTISGLLAFLLSLYLYRRKPCLENLLKEEWQRYYKGIPIDIRFAMVLVAGFGSFGLLVNSINLYYYPHLYTFVVDQVLNIVAAAVFVGLTLVLGKLLLGNLREQPGFERELSRALLYRAFQGLKEAFLIRSIGTQIFILLSVVFAFGAGTAVVLWEPEALIVYLFLWVVLGLPLLALVVKRTGYFNRIIYNVNELALGNYEADLPVLGKSILAKLADNINKLKHGVKTSQKERAKSERLRSELITNVSHDLRTPLTSIITYTELLKSPDLSKEDQEAYVQIIDRKSKRLKILIDDLFEASKMASGSIELTKDRVDLVQLLQQALAEHNETIEESTLQFRVATPEKPVYAAVDGQKIWRVFDNLIGNILKYALENTRVYISIIEAGGKAEIIFKNVTKYELGENVDEMLERFKRGDASRNTEGSGLGLAIAKSIIDLHGGRFDIGLDGDLFKITIILEALTD